MAIVALAACGPDGVTRATPSATPGGPTLGLPSANGSTTPVTIDPTLLAILPRDVASIPVIESAEGETDALADTVLPKIATAAVAAVAVDTATSDLVYALVIRLRPDVFTPSIYRDWRDSYDEGACGGVSNVVGHAEVTIGSNHVFVGTCASGLHTYHTRLEAKSILISISSTGDRRLGIVLLGTLRT